MEYLPGFAFPVPRAFASAVGAGRFEQGDVLYDDPGAYEAWRPGAGRFGWVQVLDPPRTARAAPSDAEGNRFATNWVSPVSVELGGPDGGARRVRSTQGHLFTSLWRGDWSRLEAGVPGESPPLPSSARELQRQLEAALPALRCAAPRRLSDGGLFASVVDESSEASLAKERAIRAALADGDPLPTVDLSPREAGIPDGADFHPALRVCAVLLGAHGTHWAHERLKRALYGPASGHHEALSDRFKLERHGLLVGPTGSEAEAGHSSEPR